MALFSADADYRAFAGIMTETLVKIPLRICAFCIMPNHWHFVVWPKTSNELADFFQRLSVTHATRFQHFNQRVGAGHVYQGRFKAFPIERDDHFYQVVRYVERNPLRAHLVNNAEAWRWSSLWLRNQSSTMQQTMLSDWPVSLPENWIELVNRPQNEAELESVRRCVRKGAPLGGREWTAATAKTFGLESTLRPRGRPRKFKGKETGPGAIAKPSDPDAAAPSVNRLDLNDDTQITK